MIFEQSARAWAIDARTYLREGENRHDMLKRAYVDHHKRLYPKIRKEELQELFNIGRDGRGMLAGRTQWLGGTDYAYTRACCQFNCSFLKIATVYDIVDAAWLLLNGCGTGFKPKSGTLHGFSRPIPNVQIIPSERASSDKGAEENTEILPSAENDFTWVIRVGDSAKAWAKAGGKLFVPRAIDAKKLVLDFSEVRGSGGRLKGYGWICNGSEPLATALQAMVQILNASAGQLLDEIQIMDCVNWWGTVLSSRRAAEICLFDSYSPYKAEFEKAKDRYWIDNPQRRQSNNTEMFWTKPTYSQLRELLHHADTCGGDPGICNAEAALNKAPWFAGFNPCAEILLADKGFCNLVSACLPRFRRNFSELERAVYSLARANYRQTCVELEDGVLQSGWDQTNKALRLCGTSLTGIVQAEWLTDYQIRRLRDAAVSGAYSMADELKLPRPKAVTTIKPEGTGSKTLGGLDGEITEGIHRPLGRYIFNWVNFSRHDPLVAAHETAGYKVIDNPSDPANKLICFPVQYDNVRFATVDGKQVNLEPAVSQFNRYLRWNRLWADHNVSATISYSPDELDTLCRAIYDRWDDGFIAVSTLRRADPTKTAADLGHPYLPQEVVTEEEFTDYTSRLRSVDRYAVIGQHDISLDSCERGVCPSK